MWSAGNVGYDHRLGQGNLIGSAALRGGNLCEVNRREPPRRAALTL